MKKLALAVATAILIAPPATALAGKIHHVGKLVGNPESEVRLRVAKKAGEVRKVSGFRADGAILRCESGRISLRFEIIGAIPVNERGRFKAVVPTRENRNEKLRVAGRVKGGGKKVVGSLRTSELKRKGESCIAPKQRFRTHRR